MRRGDFAAATRTYRQALQVDPNDSELKLGLARALSLGGHNGESKGVYEQILSKTPDNADALEGLGSTFLRSDQPFEARAVFERLSARHPGNPEYKLDLARVEARLGNYNHARQLLTAVLAFHPHERDAQLQLAYVKLDQGRYTAALADFSSLLKADPTDFDALLGNARVHYFRGNITYAYRLASKLVDDRPNDYDAVFLMANLERARQHPKKALELLARADQLSPGNPETLQLERTLRQEKAVALRTSASYAREISSGNSSPDLIGFAGQDLRRFVYESALDFSALPRTRSTVALDAMPATNAGSFGGGVPLHRLLTARPQRSSRSSLCAPARARFDSDRAAYEAYPRIPSPSRWPLTARSVSWARVAPSRRISILMLLWLATQFPILPFRCAWASWKTA